ncbi:MAG: dihydroorotase [Candidatus Diapherotrites archaeon]|uniref:Dihydroorotase n=1 Tax=Candidatus Iainarchaeum sp. TaxID=3101447 RepID=A0A8T4L043_9ARCH|nr:dihydroorotase [Candidatus Diapherotrites archaeon]
MDYALENGGVFVSGSFMDLNIGISEGKIADLSKLPIEAAQKIDCKGRIIIPGCIDAHVHFRVPGMEYKEDWNSGSRAALAGGITTVLDMPNTKPATTTVQLLEEKRKLVQKDSLCNFGFHFGTTTENLSELENAANENIASFKVFMGSSTGNMLIEDENVLRRIFQIAKMQNKIVSVHAEDEAIIRQNSEQHKNENSTSAHTKIRDSGCEKAAIEKALTLRREIGNKLHICHVSSLEGMEKIIVERRAGNLTCEATLHHLFLNDEDYEKLGNFAKMNPSLKSRQDNNALLHGIFDGAIDIIATDHAPHTREEKQKGYWDSPGGVPGVETMLPLMLNAAGANKISFERVVELCSEFPAKIFGIKDKGAIEIGYDADICIIDLKREWVVEGSRLQTKCKWSPFEGMKLKGVVEKTFVNGTLAYDNGAFDEGAKGREVGFYG